MVARNYSSQAVQTTLSGGITSGATSANVASVTGFPIAYPYTLVLDKGTSNEEIVEVTNASGTTLTLTRAVDGSTGLSHSNGATVVHAVTARDLREPQVHLNALANVHGMNYRASVRRAATATIPTGVATDVTLDTVDFQNGATWWTSGTSITVPNTGLYLMGVSATFQSGGTNAGVRKVQISNAGGVPQVEGNCTGTGGSSFDWFTPTGTGLVQATASDTFKITVTHTANVDLTLFQAVIYAIQLS